MLEPLEWQTLNTPFCANGTCKFLQESVVLFAAYGYVFEEECQSHRFGRDSSWHEFVGTVGTGTGETRRGVIERHGGSPDNKTSGQNAMEASAVSPFFSGGG